MKTQSMQDAREPDSLNFYMRNLVAWVNGVAGRPILTLAVVGVTAAATLYSAENIRMNSDNTKLVRQDAPQLRLTTFWSSSVAAATS